MRRYASYCLKIDHSSSNGTLLSSVFPLMHSPAVLFQRKGSISREAKGSKQNKKAHLLRSKPGRSDVSKKMQQWKGTKLMIHKKKKSCARGTKGNCKVWDQSPQESNAECRPTISKMAECTPFSYQTWYPVAECRPNIICGSWMHTTLMEIISCTGS